MDNWDTVCAIPLEAANRRLERAGLLEDFDSASQPGESIQFKLAGKYQEWRLGRGSGRLLHLQVTVSGTLRLFDRPMQPLSGVKVAVEVDLDLMPAPDLPQAQELRFKFLPPDAKHPAQAGTIVSGGEQLGDQEQIFLPFLVAADLSHRAPAMAYNLATINPVRSGQLGWLSPTASAFAFLAGPDAGSGCLAILSVTTDRDISRFPRTVDAKLPAGDEVLYLISKAMFLQHVVAPAVAAAYGAPDPGLQFDAPKQELVNNGQIGLAGVRVGLITYQPYLTDLAVGVDGGFLTSATKGKCDMKMNIELSFGSKTRCQFSFDVSSGLIGFLADPSPQTYSEKKIPCYDYLLGPIADAILAIVVEIIGDNLGGAITARMGAVAPFQQLPDFVQWSGLGDLKVSGATLDGDLHLVGKVA